MFSAFGGGMTRLTNTFQCAKKEVCMRHLTLVLLSVLAFASCGGGGNSSSTTDTTSTTPAPRNYSGIYPTYFEPTTATCSGSQNYQNYSFPVNADYVDVVVHHDGSSLFTDTSYRGTVYTDGSFTLTKTVGVYTKSYSGSFTSNGWSGTWTFNYSVGGTTCHMSTRFYSY